MERLKGLLFTSLAILAVALPLVWAFVSNYQQEKEVLEIREKHQESLPLAHIMLKDLDGKIIELSQFKNKVVFINFWATWCAPCIAEMPSIQRLSGQLPQEKIEFLLASNETSERITTFRDRQKIQLQFVQVENLEELNIPVLPTTYIINEKGDLVFSEAGSRQWDSAENVEMINKIINNE